MNDSNDFLEQFKNALNDLNFNDIQYQIEYSLKISKNNINNNRINIQFKSEKEKIKQIVPYLYNDVKNINTYLDSINNKNEQEVGFGFANGYKEIYCRLNESTNNDDRIIFGSSYEEDSKKINKWNKVIDIDNKIGKTFFEYIKNNFNIDLSTIIVDYSNNGTLIKNDTWFYKFWLISLHQHKEIIKKICYKINKSDIEMINNFLDEEKHICVISWNIDENNDITLNLYIR
jgi:hypothetical protein